MERKERNKGEEEGEGEREKERSRVWTSGCLKYVSPPRHHAL